MSDPLDAALQTLDVAIFKLAALTDTEERTRWQRADLVLWIYTHHREEYADALDEAGVGQDEGRRLRWMARKVPARFRPPTSVMPWSAVMALAGLDVETDGPVEAADSAVEPALLIARAFGFTSCAEAERLRDLLDGMDRPTLLFALDVLETGKPPQAHAIERREWAVQVLLTMRQDLTLDGPPDDLPDPTTTTLAAFARAEVLRAVPGARRIRVLDQIVEATVRAVRMWESRQT